jgi:hypothetical protein
MSGINGYPTSKRLENDLQEKIKKEFITVQPVGSNKHALDTLNYGIYMVSEGAVAEVGSSDKILKITGHGAKKGDVVRIQSSSNNIEEFEIAVFEVIDADTLELTAVLSDQLVAGDTVDILRPLLFKLEADGSLTLAQGPIQIVKDGVNTEVAKDSSVPANTVPIPVEVVAASGTPINITAGDLNVQLTHLGVNFDSIRLGDGTNLLSINGSGEAAVNDASANTTLTNILAAFSPLATEATLSTLATETTLAAVGTALGDILAELLGKAEESTLLSIDGKVATEATLAALNAKFNSLGQKPSANSAPAVLSTEQEAILQAIVTALGVTNAKDFATETTLAQIEGKTPTVGQKASAASSPVVLSTEQEALIDQIEALLGSIDTKTPALGQALKVASVPVTIASDQEITTSNLDVVDLIDSDILNPSVTNIPGSASLPLQIVASTAQDIKKIKVIEDVGEFIGLYEGVATAETLICILPPGFTGGDLEVFIPSGTRLSIKNMKSAVINTDTRFAINFLG